MKKAHRHVNCGGNAMKRFRLRTLMLLIVIAALCMGLAVQHRRAARREAQLNAELANKNRELAAMRVRSTNYISIGQTQRARDLLKWQQEQSKPASSKGKIVNLFLE
jgi:hypothetical protein